MRRRPDTGRGLSPRVRGKLAQPAPLFVPVRSIPACAGEAFGEPHPRRNGGVYPRVCGGSYAPPMDGFRAGGLSPRVRGKRR